MTTVAGQACWTDLVRPSNASANCRWVPGPPARTIHSPTSGHSSSSAHERRPLYSGAHGSTGRDAVRRQPLRRAPCGSERGRRLQRQHAARHPGALSRGLWRGSRALASAPRSAGRDRLRAAPCPQADRQGHGCRPGSERGRGRRRRLAAAEPPCRSRPADRATRRPSGRTGQAGTGPADPGADMALHGARRRLTGQRGRGTVDVR